jgi:hypothetical protein
MVAVRLVNLIGSLTIAVTAPLLAACGTAQKLARPVTSGVFRAGS